MMGCSASTSCALDMPMPTRDHPESAAVCCRTPPILQPPPTVSQSHLFVDPNSPRPESVIDAWDLIDADDDEEEYHLVARIQSSFRDGTLHKLLETYEIVEPIWKQHLSAEGSLLDTLSTISPKPVADVSRSLKSTRFGFQQSDASGQAIYTALGSRKGENDDKIVLYITSLRGIRKTYDDCCAIKSILDGLRLEVDERDIAMDVKYRRELQSSLGLEGRAVAVPQLFIGAEHVGGVDEVRRLNELGELRKLLEGHPVRHSTLVCYLCGGARFRLCTHCSGSTKVFDEEHGVSRKCCHCSENGLVRCLNCNP